MNNLLSIFLRYSERWQRIVFRFNGPLALSHYPQHSILFKVPKLHRLPMLRVAAIGENKAWDNSSVTTIWQTILTNPSLRQITSSIPITHSPHLVSFTLHPTFVTPSTVLKILKSCRSLQHLDVRLCSPNPNEDPLPVVHEKLKELVISNSTADDTLVGTVISRLTAPYLIKLDMTFDGGPGMMRSLHEMIVRSDCYLLHLNTIPFDGLEKGFMRLMALPQLHYLRTLIISSLHGDDFLNWLILPRDVSQNAYKLGERHPDVVKANMPYLRYMKLFGLTASVRAFANMVASRQSSLRHMIVEAPWHFDEMPEVSKYSKKLFSHPGLKFKNPCGAPVPAPQVVQPWYPIDAEKDEIESCRRQCHQSISRRKASVIAI
jgi:hypothetical protein